MRKEKEDVEEKEKEDALEIINKRRKRMEMD